MGEFQGQIDLSIATQRGLISDLTHAKTVHHCEGGLENETAAGRSILIHPVDGMCHAHPT
jgi:hypothetical protein